MTLTQKNTFDKLKENKEIAFYKFISNEFKNLKINTFGFFK